MIRKVLLATLLAGGFWFAGTPAHAQDDAASNTIAFASCVNESDGESIWSAVAATNPAVFACLEQYPAGSYGLIRVDGSAAEPALTIEIRSFDNELLAEHAISLQPAAETPAEDASTAEPALNPSIPVVTATLKTRPILDMDAADLPEGGRMGDMDDPAIWVHPVDASQSIVVSALKEGGLEVYDLEGNVLQSFSPEGVRYNNVDLLYDVELGGDTVDLVAFTDRFGDKFAFYRIDPTTRTLVDVTDPGTPLLFTPAGQESDE